MKSKQGYRDQKTKFSSGNWFKYYFQKFTCRNIGGNKQLKELSYPEIISPMVKEFTEKVNSLLDCENQNEKKN